MRVVLLIVVIIAAVWFVRRLLARASGDGAASPQPPKTGELVGCARCGLLLPRAEAREVGGLLFCSDEHARLGSKS